MPVLFPDLVAEIAFTTPSASAYLRLLGDMVASANSHVHKDMSDVTDYVIQAGDYVEYDLWWEESGTRSGFDFECNDATASSPAKRLAHSGAVDQNGHSADPGTNLADALILRKWYARKIAIPLALVGKTISQWTLACDADAEAPVSGRIRDIRITDGFGTIRKDVWRQVMPLPTLVLWRESPGGATSTTTTAALALGAGTVPVASTTGFPAAGQAVLGDPISDVGYDGRVFSYTSKDATNFFGCTNVPATVSWPVTVKTLGGSLLTVTRKYEEPVFSDVTEWLLEAHPRHGRRKVLDRPESGQMTVVLDSARGTFDPENDASPFWPNIRGGLRMRLRVRHYYELLKTDGADSIWRLNEPAYTPLDQIVYVEDIVGFYRGSTTGVTSTAAQLGEPSILVDDGAETAMRLDGTDYVTMGDIIPYRFKSQEVFSIAVVIRPESGSLLLDGITRTIISNLRLVAAKKNGWQLSILNGKVRLSRWLDETENAVESVSALSQDTVYVVHGLYDGTNLRLFVDGAQSAQAASSLVLLDAVGDVRFGSPAAGGDSFIGRVSSAAIFATPILTDAQIRSHYDKRIFACPGDLFDGTIEDWPISWRGRLPEVSLVVNDAGARLARADISGFRAIELTGSRIAWALDQANFGGARRLDPGRSLVEESGSAAGTLLDGDPALDHILDIAEAEVGFFFIAGDGAAVFHDRLRRPTATTVLGIFTNDPPNVTPAGKLAVDIAPNESDDAVLNDIRLRPIGGVTDAVAVDLGSQLQHDKRSLSRTLWLSTLPECQSQAEWMLSQFKDSKLRFDQITIDPKRDLPGLVPHVLKREVSDRVAVDYRMPSGQPGPIDNFTNIRSIECYIEGVEHDIVTRGGRWSWQTRWALSSADSQAYWILGDADNSLLGESTVLGY